MYQIRRKLFSQNFLQDRKLITKLLGYTSIGKNDLVLEIGPGKGILTEQLINRSGHVLAVEFDNYWYRQLRNKFQHIGNLTLYNTDILHHKLPSLPYKVFANIPFAIEGVVIRKLIDAHNPPEDSYLVVRKNLAERLSGKHGENMFSTMHKPWFDFSILYNFKQTDFIPTPRVEAVLFRFNKRFKPLLTWNELRKYISFIEGAYKNGTPIYQNLKQKYGKQKTKIVLKKRGISTETKPGMISLNTWLLLYEDFSR